LRPDIHALRQSLREFLVLGYRSKNRILALGRSALGGAGAVGIGKVAGNQIQSQPLGA